MTGPWAVEVLLGGTGGGVFVGRVGVCSFSSDVWGLSVSSYSEGIR